MAHHPDEVIDKHYRINPSTGERMAFGRLVDGRPVLCGGPHPRKNTWVEAKQSWVLWSTCRRVKL